jgi:hypothetical protein
VLLFIDVWLYGQELLKNISLGMYLVGGSEAGYRIHILLAHPRVIVSA